VEGDAEGQREDDGQGKRERPAAERVGEGSDDYCADCEEDNDSSGVVAEVDDLVGVPLVAEDQDREEGDRQQHRCRARAAWREEDRGGAGGCCDDYAGAG